VHHDLVTVPTVQGLGAVLQVALGKKRERIGAPRRQLAS